jgi:hypothetical protein
MDHRMVFEGPGQMQATRTKVIACATVIEEMLPHLPPGVDYYVLDFGLHVNPEALKRVLQEAVDALATSAETILLGYGLCSQAVVGLRANEFTLVVPKVDDCIAIFLGSEEAYKAQFHGEEKARWLIGQILKNYTRLALINTGQYELERYRDYSRRTAERFGLRYEEIPGSNTLIKKMLHGPWDDEFVVTRPGETISYLDFKRSKSKV